MNTLIRKIVLGFMAASLVGVGVLFYGKGVALAQDDGPAATFSDPKDVQRALDLERFYKGYQALYAQIGAGLERGNLDISTAQSRIDALNAQGADSGELQGVLDEFQGQLPIVKKAYADAGTILYYHHGFNLAGQVTDMGDADNTSKQLTSFLGTASGALNPALARLETAIQKYAHPTPIPVTGASTTITPAPASVVSPFNAPNDGPLTLNSLAVRTVLPSFTEDNDIQAALDMQRFFAGYYGSYVGQAGLLAQANFAINRANNVITDLNNRGKDSSALADALATFQGKLEEAQKAYDSATVVFTAHHGFNVLGQVYDLYDASVTLKNATSYVGTVQGVLSPALDRFNNQISLYKAQ